MASTPQELIREVLEALGLEELRRAKAAVGSRTLRAAMRLIVEEGQRRARIFIPHYWAIYYHDGRGAVSPTSARKLVFFDDPSDDPRLAGGSPERASAIRTLSRRDYQRGLEINRQRAASGRRPFMYVVDRTGPAAGKPFFDQQARGAARRADPTVQRLLDDYVQSLVDQDRRGDDTGTARFRIQ